MEGVTHGNAVKQAGVMPTGDTIAGVPTTLVAICLNTNGAKQVKGSGALECLVSVLTTPTYIRALTVSFAIPVSMSNHLHLVAQQIHAMNAKNAPICYEKGWPLPDGKLRCILESRRHMFPCCCHQNKIVMQNKIMRSPLRCVSSGPPRASWRALSTLMPGIALLLLTNAVPLGCADGHSRQAGDRAG